MASDDKPTRRRWLRTVVAGLAGAGAGGAVVKYGCQPANTEIAPRKKPDKLDWGNWDGPIEPFLMPGEVHVSGSTDIPVSLVKEFLGGKYNPTEMQLKILREKGKLKDKDLNNLNFHTTIYTITFTCIRSDGDKTKQQDYKIPVTIATFEPLTDMYVQLLLASLSKNDDIKRKIDMSFQGIMPEEFAKELEAKWKILREKIEEKQKQQLAPDAPKMPKPEIDEILQTAEQICKTISAAKDTITARERAGGGIGITG